MDFKLGDRVRIPINDGYPIGIIRSIRSADFGRCTGLTNAGDGAAFRVGRGRAVGDVNHLVLRFGAACPIVLELVDYKYPGGFDMDIGNCHSYPVDMIEKIEDTLSKRIERIDVETAEAYEKAMEQTYGKKSDPWSLGGYLYSLDGKFEGTVVQIEEYENRQLFALQNSGEIKSYFADELCDVYDLEIQHEEKKEKRSIRRRALGFLLVIASLLGTAGVIIAADTLCYEWAMAMYNNIQLKVDR